MNCKPGDLAMIVGTRGLNVGKIVRCVSRYDGPWLNSDSEPGWHVDLEMRNSYGFLQSQVADRFLRPIRDPGPDAVDEMLVKLGKPATVTA